MDSVASGIDLDPKLVVRFSRPERGRWCRVALSENRRVFVSLATDPAEIRRLIDDSKRAREHLGVLLSVSQSIVQASDELSPQNAIRAEYIAAAPAPTEAQLATVNELSIDFRKCTHQFLFSLTAGPCPPRPPSRVARRRSPREIESGEGHSGKSSRQRRPDAR